jgi:hypothetical protein
VPMPRANDPDTIINSCVAGAETQLSDCQLELAALGVSFTPTYVADASPEDFPNLTCHVEDPVHVHSPLFGVDLRYYDDTPTPNVLLACNAALALAQTADDAAASGATVIRHIGTYNCRVIAGTSTLSQHAFGDAIDIYGYEFGADNTLGVADGTVVTLIDHWEHDTTNPVSVEAQWLYDASWRYYDNYIWNIILTPNYNAAHDNHFHVDMTDGSHFRGLGDYRYIGPNPYPEGE